MAFNDSYGGNPLDNPNRNFFGGWNSFGNRSGGGGNGGSGQGYPGGGGGNGGGGGGMPNLPGPVPNESGNNTTPGAPPGGPDPNNFGQAMHPWDMPYGGQFTAPMSPYENNALQGYNDFVGGGMGLNQSGNYLNDVLGGKYLDINSNPWLQQIQHGMQGMKDYSDQQGLARIGSSMALGGNALSGARLGASNDFMNNSNNAFEALMGNLMNQNYGMERNAMNQAPGQAANLANTAGGAYSQLFGMGSLPRNLQQHDYDSQYNDFLRQTGAMNHDSERPDNQLLQFLSNAGYKGQYNPTYGSSQGDILGNLMGQGGWGDILQQLLSGAGEGLSGGNDGVVIGHDGVDEEPVAPDRGSPYYSERPNRLRGYQPESEGGDQNDRELINTLIYQWMRNHGRDPYGPSGLRKTPFDDLKPRQKTIGHDGPAAPAAAGPANYYDRDWYQNALQQAKVKQLASMQNPNPNSNGMAIAALLMSILGSGGKKKSGGVGMGGGGGSLANSAGKAAGSGIKSLWDSIFGKKPETMGGPNDPFANSLDTPGSPYYQGPGGDTSGLFDPNNFAGNPNDSYNDPGTSYYNDPLFNPDNFAGNYGDFGGSGGGDYIPSDVQF